MALSTPKGPRSRSSLTQPDLPHTDPASIPRGDAGLAEAIAAQSFSTSYGSMYPDLYTVLSMHLGDDEAGKLWSAACSYADAAAELDEAVGGLTRSVTDALHAIDKLRKRVRDVNNLTDGDISSDADTELETASRSMRNVRRIISEYLQ